VSIEEVVKGCGVQFCRVADPLDLPGFTLLMKEAVAYSRTEGLAVVIARSPCLVDRSVKHAKRPQAVVEASACSGCQLCTRQFECPALVYDSASHTVSVDIMLCSGCAVCTEVCPTGAIQKRAQG